MDSQNPNPNRGFPSAPPGFFAPLLTVKQEPYDEPPQLSEVTEHRLQRCIKDLVRVSDLDVQDRSKFRATVRSIRMVYDFLRVMTMVEEDNEVDVLSERGNLRVAAMMRRSGLLLNRDKKIIGTIPGICIGDVFLNIMELVVVGLHGKPQSGIDYLPNDMSSNGEPIATSVIVSGEYDNSVDLGDLIYYCHGGHNNKNSSQVLNQKLEDENFAMERSMHYGIEVRVIRGVQLEGTSFTSSKVYFYDGLYRIVDCKFDVGVYTFKLRRVEGQMKTDSVVMKEALRTRNHPLWYKHMFVLALDISNKKENVGVRLFNDVDGNNDPMSFEYLPRVVFPPLIVHQSKRVVGCKCIGECVEGCFCFMKNGNECPYTQSGILLKGRPLVFECGPFCSCLPNCRNRVTQHGLKHGLEVFRSKETGWGVRSLDMIQAGSFICEYTGVFLTKEQAEIFIMNGDSLIYPSHFTESWKEWGNLSLIDASYKCPLYPSIPPLDFAMDVSTTRNVASYISHSSTPNVMVQFVLYDHNDLMYPHLMLFAIENIPPMREFSLDYGVANDDLA